MTDAVAFHIGKLPEATGGAVTRTAAYQAIREGKLVARKSGRRTIILADDLRAFLETLPRVKAAA